MRVAVRPPELFPRFAYAALLHAVDVFVIADTFAYSRQSFQNRCRIRTPGEGAWAWLTLPLAAGAPTRPLLDVALAPTPRTAAVHRKTLTHHLGSAPFFLHYAPDVAALLDAPAGSLGALTTETVRWTARALAATARIEVASALPGAPGDPGALLAAVGAETLVTLPESAARDAAHAEAAGIACEVLPVEEQPRRQNFPGFAPDCASFDLLMNFGPEAPLLVHAAARSAMRSL